MIAHSADAMLHSARAGALGQLVTVSSVQVRLVRLDNDVSRIHAAGKTFSADVACVVAGWDLDSAKEQVHCPRSWTGLLLLTVDTPAKLQLRVAVPANGQTRDEASWSVW